MRRLLLALILSLPLLRPPAAEACAPAPRAGHEVRIAGEEALIVWDAATKTEHFVRRGHFEVRAADGGPADFGFLVPTPTKPTLTETSDAVFDELERATRPKQQTVREPDLDVGFACFTTLARRAADDRDGAAPKTAVKVLEEKRVAGLDAAVLAADDAPALALWLTEHGYPMRPMLTAWLGPYVQKKWIVTAFKIAGGTAVGTRALRMTFTTDRPFYPYREPEDARTGATGSRRLDVWVLSDDGPVAPTLDDGTAFVGIERWAHPLASPNAVLPSLFATKGSGAWLQHFRDDSSPRPGTADLVFPKRSVPREIEPAPEILRVRDPVFVPIDLIVLAVAGVLVVVRVASRKNSPPKP